MEDIRGRCRQLEYDLAQAVQVSNQQIAERSVNGAISWSVSMAVFISFSIPVLRGQMKSNKILFGNNNKNTLYIYMSNKNKKVLLRAGHVAHYLPSSCDPKA